MPDTSLVTTFDATTEIANGVHDASVHDIELTRRGNR